ncbi:MAG: imidazolonepropionase [Pseudomonadota bacterium]
MPSLLLTNATLACLDTADGYGLAARGALLVDGGRIAWTGAADGAPGADETIDCGGRLLSPGLIDCHTHLVYGGDRTREFEMRLEGASYEAIARAGGGIASTVAATRAASAEELIEQSLPRLMALIGDGVTTVEIKSGYGLDRETELRMLEVAGRLGERAGVRVQRTLLAAHAVPEEYRGNPDGYIDWVAGDLLPHAQAAGLTDAVDIFIEGIGFNTDQAERLFAAAANLGVPIKAHVEQLSDQGGARLAARYQALSVDHLEYLSEEDVARLGRDGPVAVLLPGAFLTLGETRRPPIDALRRHGVPMAVATDANPGSSPIFSLLDAMHLACALFRITPAEALRGVTVNAAKALGLAHEIGMLRVGHRADLVLWQVDDPAALSYRLGINPVDGILQDGHWRRRPGAAEAA